MKKDDTYNATLAELKSKIASAQVKTVFAANQQMIWLYWQIGKTLLIETEKQNWGAKVIEQFSKDIRTTYPDLKGFSPRNMLYMKQFARVYPESHILLFETAWRKALQNTQQAVALIPETNLTDLPITQQVVAQLDEKTFLTSPLANISWSHHIILLDKVRDYKKAFWYMLNSIENGISRNTLAFQIETELFERQMKVKKMNNFSRTLPAPQSDFADYIMKDPYIFDFIQAKANADERNIELQLENHMVRFLMELGKGFAFVGRQIRFNVGESDYFLDLLFYHLHMRCYIVIELKARKFEPGDAGQLNFYINIVNDRFKSEFDHPTIGILLCKGKNEIMVEYALTGYNQPMGISEYKLSKVIPKNLRSELPSIEEIENSLSE